MLDRPSKQVEEVGNWWIKIVAASNKHQSMDEARDFGENWASLTAEPGGVTILKPMPVACLQCGRFPKYVCKIA